MLAERDIDAQPMALADEPVAKRLGNAEEHLELVLIAPEPAPGDDPAPFRDEPLVVRGDSYVAAGVEQRLEPAHEVRAHLLVALVGNLGRLDVDALADPNARPQVGEGADVVERPSQVRLEDDADVLVARLG